MEGLEKMENMSHGPLPSSNPESVHRGDEIEFNLPPQKCAQPMAIKRLNNDYMQIKRDPIPYIFAEPDPINILIWHYCLIGPPGTPYENGIYHGKLRFPSDFPFNPPSIYMITPNGRFQIKKRLCLTISDYEPTKWTPAWNVGTILSGILSFMVEDTKTWGSIECSDQVRVSLANKSGKINIKNKEFCELFPKLVELINSGQVPKFDQKLEKQVDENENDDDLLSVSSESEDEYDSDENLEEDKNMS